MDDHIVPQQMIARFAGEDGTLFELVKPKLVIGTKSKRPKGILFKQDYYKDHVSNFDDDLLKKVEQKFALHYPDLADKPWTGKKLNGEAGAALVSWIAAMFCRTSMIIAMTKAVAAKQTTPVSVALKVAPQLIENIFRSECYERNLDLISRPKFEWKIARLNDERSFVLTDNPVIVTPIINGEAVWLVPLSRKRLLVGGHATATEYWRRATPRFINAVMASWADQRVYSADKNTLEKLIEDLKGEGEAKLPAKFRELAQKPLFGMLEHVAATDAPSGMQLDGWWDKMVDGFGPSIIPKEHRAKPSRKSHVPSRD